MEEKHLIIDKKLSYGTIEKYLSIINNTTTQLNLEIPIKPDYKGFGYLPSLLLVIFSWMRKNSGKLIIDLKVQDGLEIKEFVTDYYGYAIISTIWKTCDIVNKEGESLKKHFIPYTAKMHEMIDHLDKGLPNEAILIPCFDHYSKEKGLSHWFYFSDYKFAVAPSQLETSVYRIIEKLRTIYYSRIQNNTLDLFDSLLKIVWELLRNTDEHATKDYLNESKLMPNCRGIYFKIHRSSAKNLIEQSDHDGLKSFFSESFSNVSSPFLLEISVFDSGPGLVKRFLGRDWLESITINQEIDTIKQCLIKGQTSVNNVDGLSKGYGLDEVLKVLGKKEGFLKIRTGRASVFRDLRKSPYNLTQNIENVDLYDWDSMSNTEYSKMNPTEGTLITLAYPLT